MDEFTRFQMNNYFPFVNKTKTELEDIQRQLKIPNQALIDAITAVRGELEELREEINTIKLSQAKPDKPITYNVPTRAKPSFFERLFNK